MILYNKYFWSFIVFAFITTCIIAVFGQNIIQLRNSHRAMKISTSQTTYLADLTDISYMNELLDNILVPRVVGTESHEGVYQYIKSELKRLGFSVEVDEFINDTPLFGRLKFRNIIGSLNSDAERFLILACHYDSKYYKDIEFIGAVDSGVPCAMMLNLAKVMKDELDEAKGNNNLSLKLLFFDGEEAFHQWGPKDSIYGARNLAAEWHKSRSSTKSGQTVSELNRIDVMVLLDLIGSIDPVFPSYFKDTERWYTVLADAEKKLHRNGVLKRRTSNANTYFPRRATNSFIEDDHLPFLRKGVPILHLIPTPFPKVWHTESDNRANIDMNTIENLNKILRIFVAQYLHLTISSQNFTDTNTSHNNEL